MQDAASHGRWRNDRNAGSDTQKSRWDQRLFCVLIDIARVKMVFRCFILFRRSSGFHLPGGRLRIGGWFILHNGFLQFLPHAMGGIFKLPDTAPQRTGKIGYLFRPKKQQDD